MHRRHKGVSGNLKPRRGMRARRHYDEISNDRPASIGLFIIFHSPSCEGDTPCRSVPDAEKVMVSVLIGNRIIHVVAAVIKRKRTATMKWPSLMNRFVGDEVLMS